MEKPGCYISATAAMVLGIVATSFAQCNRANAQQGQQNEMPVRKIATIGKFVVDGNLIEKNAETASSPDMPASGVAAGLAQLLAVDIESGVVSNLAQEKGLGVSDTDVNRMEDELIQADAARGGAKPTVQQIAQQKAAFESSTMRPEIVALAAREKLKDSIAANIKLTDDDLKETYNIYTVKKILFKAEAGKDVKAAAEKALDEIKQSKGPFETFIDRYSQADSEPSKKLSESTSTLSGPDLDGDIGAKIRVLKPGGVSEVVTDPEGFAIYKLESVKGNVPKDFDKSKDGVRAMEVQRQASAQLEVEVKAAVKAAKIDWISPGYHALYDWGNLDSQNLDAAAKTKALNEIAQRAKDCIAAGTDADGQRAAQLTYYACVDNLYTQATPAEQKKMAQQRVDSILAATNAVPQDLSVRVQLIDAYMDLGDGKDAVVTLTDVASTNANTDTPGQQIWNSVNDEVSKLKAAKVLSSDDEKAIQASQDSWRQNKKQADADAAEEAKQEAADRATSAAQEAKDEAAAKKAAGDQPKGNAPPKKPTVRGK